MMILIESHSATRVKKLLYYLLDISAFESRLTMAGNRSSNPQGLEPQVRKLRGFIKECCANILQKEEGSAEELQAMNDAAEQILAKGHEADNECKIVVYLSLGNNHTVR